MTSDPASPDLQRRGRSRSHRWILWVLFCALLIPIGVRLDHQIRDSLDLPRGTMRFFDFRIFQSALKEVRRGEPLYQTDRRDYFEPGSAVYKYPPPFAAILHPFDSPRWKPIARGFYYANLGVLALTLVLLLASFRSSLGRKLGAALIFLAWQPFHESLAGLQLEPMMVCLVALGLALDRRTRSHSFVAFAVGAAAAFKVYPAVLGLFYLLRRDWRGIVAAGAGGLLLLGLSAIPLSLRESWIYFTKVLPGLGGTSLVLDNVSLLSGLGRALLRLAVDAERFAELVSASGLHTVEASGVAWVSPVSKLLLVVISAALISTTVARLRQVANPKEAGLLGLFCSISLMTLLIPTSWVDYQTWLILPTVYLAYRAQSPVAWCLLAISILPAVSINSGDAHYADHQWALSISRGLIPITLWAGLLDTARNEPTGAARVDSGTPGGHSLTAP